eukprot:6094852-Pleurochrysis_carterae.AAC.1
MRKAQGRVKRTGPDETHDAACADSIRNGRSTRRDATKRMTKYVKKGTRKKRDTRGETRQTACAARPRGRATVILSRACTPTGDCTRLAHQPRASLTSHAPNPSPSPSMSLP